MRLVGCALLALLATGCFWERSAKIDKRMARLQMGANTRRIAMPSPEPAYYGTGRLARTTTPTEPAANTDLSQGVTGNLQFTMRQTRNLYAGGEIEFGPFSRPGSYYGGAYAVLGAETRSSRGSISVELTGGRQWLRYEFGAKDVPVNMLEPRARAQLSLNEQISLGGVIGAGLLGDAGWMAGIYLGVYSQAFSGN